MREIEKQQVASTLNQVVLKKLGPSSFFHLQQNCKYQKCLEIAERLLQAPLGMPPNSKALIGTVVHKLHEARYKGHIPNDSKFEEKWEEYIGEEEQKVFLKYGSKLSLSDYELMYHYEDIILQEEVLTAYSSSIPHINRAELAVSNNYLFGSIDRIRFHENNVEIIDFKTCVIDESNVQESYQCQLKLYAMLFQQTYPQFTVTKLTLIDTTNSSIDVPFTQAELKELNQSVEIFYNSFKKDIELRDWEKLANPSSETCRLCSMRTACEFFWRDSSDGFIDIEGLVEELNSTGLRLYRTKDGKVVHIKIKDGSVRLDPPVGSTIRLVNLYPSPQNVEVLFFTKMSYGIIVK